MGDTIPFQEKWVMSPIKNSRSEKKEPGGRGPSGLEVLRERR